jgi:hypothetical protein
MLAKADSAGLAAAGWYGHDVGVRCLLAAICCEKGDVPGNLASHLRLLADAASAGCRLAVFPEMSLTGSADPAASPERLILGFGGGDPPVYVGQNAGADPGSNGNSARLTLSSSSAPRPVG